MSAVLRLPELLAEEGLVIKNFKDSFYLGTLNADNLREGKGVCVYKNGRRYEGFWAADKRHGKGFERFTNGNTYEGTFD
jgi:hypothetical protein